MKKALLFLLSPCIAIAVGAQNALTISPGNNLYISSSNILNVQGLSISPSTTFTMSGVSVIKNNATTNAGLSNTVSRSYLFSTTTAPFSGTIRIYYTDAERGSLNESLLQAQSYTGSAWQTLGATSRDAVNNYVEVTGLTNKTFSELSLSVNSTLPLNWLQVRAERQQSNVLIRWITSGEVNVSHFFVQRSLSDGGWEIITDNIQAANTISDHQYEYVDADYTAGNVFYRIGQTDLGGHVTYSKIVTPCALDGSSTLKIYPNPATGRFNVQLDRPAEIQEIQLYHLSGALIQKWQAPQASYTIEHLPPGVYQLCVLEKDGKQHFLSLIKN